MRLDYDATNYEQVLQYYETRARQLLYDNYIWSKQIEAIGNWGFKTHFTNNSIQYESVYVMQQHRGRGYAKEYWKTSNAVCITTPSCHIQDFLESIKKDYVLAGLHTLWPTYRVIESWYGNRRAQRSGIYLMNHIDEGLAILNKINASKLAMRGFCLHPLVQTDADLSSTLTHISSASDNNILSVDVADWVIAMEYRSVANEYLSTRQIKSVEEIRLSSIQAVNEMLIADKIQNYKDFCLYHKNSHARSEQLNEYFHNWFEKLQLSSTKVEELIRYISL